MQDLIFFKYRVDTRSNSQKGNSILIHKKGTKVVGLHCNPFQPDLLLSCGNDHFVNFLTFYHFLDYFILFLFLYVCEYQARIWDIRRLEAESCLQSLPHKRVVNSAYFSPISGSKIVTTSIDNRIRVWDSIFGNLETPSREIVHSHDFNRHLTPFRAEWDPKVISDMLYFIHQIIYSQKQGK